MCLYFVPESLPFLVLKEESLELFLYPQHRAQ